MSTCLRRKYITMSLLFMILLLSVFSFVPKIVHADDCTRSGNTFFCSAESECGAHLPNIVSPYFDGSFAGEECVCLWITCDTYPCPYESCICCVYYQCTSSSTVSCDTTGVNGSQCSGTQ